MFHTLMSAQLQNSQLVHLKQVGGTILVRIQWPWSKVVVFVLLTFAISTIFYIIMYLTGSARDIGALWMWSPAMGAILTLWLFGGRIRDLGWGSGQRKFLFWGLIIPLLYASIIYGTAWATGVAGFRPPSLTYILFLPMGFLAACLAALGEEIGWRGFFVPELAKLTTFSKTALISWLVWSVWHYPAILFADYHSQAPRWFDISSLTITVLGLSFFTAWLRLKSGSLWPVVAWHGAHNLFIQEAFVHMSMDTPISKFILDDFGLGLVLASLVLGFICWRRSFEVRCLFHLQQKEGG